MPSGTFSTCKWKFAQKNTGRGDKDRETILELTRPPRGPAPYLGGTVALPTAFPIETVISIKTILWLDNPHLPPLYAAISPSSTATHCLNIQVKHVMRRQIVQTLPCEMCKVAVSLF